MYIRSGVWVISTRIDMEKNKSRRPSLRLHLFITILMLVVLAMTVTNCLTLQTALELQIDSFTQEMQGSCADTATLWFRVL